MEQKRENILFPLGFNSLSITTMAYTMRLKTEIREDVDKKLVEFKKNLECELREKIESELREKIESELREKLSKDIYNEVYEKLLEKFRRHDDGWEQVEQIEK
jgi:hypothetical protein